jgi:hypothetical protein
VATDFRRLDAAAPYRPPHAGDAKSKVGGVVMEIDSKLLRLRMWSRRQAEPRRE